MSVSRILIFYPNILCTSSFNVFVHVLTMMSFLKTFSLQFPCVCVYLVSISFLLSLSNFCSLCAFLIFIVFVVYYTCFKFSVIVVYLLEESMLFLLSQLLSYCCCYFFVIALNVVAIFVGVAFAAAYVMCYVMVVSEYCVLSCKIKLLINF